MKSILFCEDSKIEIETHYEIIERNNPHLILIKLQKKLLINF